MQKADTRQTSKTDQSVRDKVSKFQNNRHLVCFERRKTKTIETFAFYFTRHLVSYTTAEF